MMQLDVPTLMVAGAFVASASAALLLFAWYQYRETSAALWWAGADATLACGIVLIAVGSATHHSALFGAGLTLFLVSSGLTWGGARSFDGHKVQLTIVAGGSVIWLITHWLYQGLIGTTMAPALHAATTLFYYGSAAISLKRGKGEALRARAPLAVLLSIHAATLLLAIPASLTMTQVPNEPPPVMSWFGVIHFETIVFSIGTALFLVTMMKERSEGRHIDASSTDSLTGLLNRRGFLMKAERLLERSRRDGVPAAMIIFDLDRFKSINDDFGHAVGDRALQIYAEVCRRTLRPGDLIGRIGGEEFAVVLPGFGVEAGCAMAERVRREFALAAVVIDGNAVNATVCGGVTADAGSEDIHGLLKQADIALYQAKGRGRNRVERFDPHTGGDGTGNIIRVA